VNRFRSFVGFFSACAVAAGLAGCAGGGPQRYAVSGEVKWRGKPLDHGGIIFLPDDPSLGASGGSAIKDGRYSIAAKQGLLPGRYKVMITSADPTKAPDPDALPGPAGPLPKDRVHPKYNAQTVLTADVKADSPNTINFDVD
jgi:hypothetical protein